MSKKFLTILNVLSTFLTNPQSQVNPVAHLSIEYSANLEPDIDMAVFCDVARQAMVKTEIFPVAGIRVRAFRADHASLANGDKMHGFIDMILRMGPGREKNARLSAMESIYAALEEMVKEKINQPVALTLEIQEINYPFAEKRLNTIRTALESQRKNDA